MSTEITGDRAGGLRTQVQMIQTEIDIFREGGSDPTDMDDLQSRLNRMANGDKNFSWKDLGELCNILSETAIEYLHNIFDREEEGHPITYYKFGNEHFADDPTTVDLLESNHFPNGDQKNALEFFRNLEEEHSVY